MGRLPPPHFLFVCFVGPFSVKKIGVFRRWVRPLDTWADHDGMNSSSLPSEAEIILSCQRSGASLGPSADPCVVVSARGLLVCQLIHPSSGRGAPWPFYLCQSSSLNSRPFHRGSGCDIQLTLVFLFSRALPVPLFSSARRLTRSQRRVSCISRPLKGLISSLEVAAFAAYHLNLVPT